MLCYSAMSPTLLLFGACRPLGLGFSWGFVLRVRRKCYVPYTPNHLARDAGKEAGWVTGSRSRILPTLRARRWWFLDSAWSSLVAVLPGAGKGS